MSIVPAVCYVLAFPFLYDEGVHEDFINGGMEPKGAVANLRWATKAAGLNLR